MAKNMKNPPNPQRALEEADIPVQTYSQARAYVSTSRDVGRSDTIVTGTLLVLGYYAFTIFDSGLTHSFISVPFVRQAGFEL